MFTFTFALKKILQLPSYLPVKRNPESSQYLPVPSPVQNMLFRFVTLPQVVICCLCVPGSCEIVSISLLVVFPESVRFAEEM